MCRFNSKCISGGKGAIPIEYVNSTRVDNLEFLKIYKLDSPKDHIEKIDFQEIFIAVVNWPIS